MSRDQPTDGTIYESGQGAPNSCKSPCLGLTVKNMVT